MRLRGPFVITGALGLAMLAAGLVAVRTSVASAQAIADARVATKVTVNPGITFAPPPSNAAPGLTAAQAFATWSPGTAVPSDVSVQLGLLSVLVGPDCGAECENGNIVQGGMVYSALNQLAYGFEWSTSCLSLGPDAPQQPPGGCIQWNFIDANTGHQIIVAYQPKHS